MRVVIVGGDAAGMSAASQIKRRKPNVEVIVLEQGFDVSYGQCGMPFNLADPNRDMNDVVVMTADTFITKRGIDLRLGHRVTDILPRQNTVIIKTKENTYQLKYDKLIAATGASPIKPAISGINSNRILYFHNLESARNLKTILTQDGAERFAIVGAGLVGMEVAEALIKRNKKVSLIEQRNTPFPFLGETISKKLQEKISEYKIESYFGTTLLSIEEKNNQLQLNLDNKKHINVDYTIMAVGIKPNSEIFANAEVKLGPNGAIATDEYLYTNNPNILAAGDCADAFYVVNGEKTYVPLALRANRAGKLAGANAVGFKLKAPPISGTAGLKFFDLEVAWSGLDVQNAKNSGFKPVVQEVTTRSKAHSFPDNGKITVRLIGDKKSKKLLGGALAGPVNSTALRIDVISAALYHKATIDDLANYDLIYSPPFGPTWSPVLVCASQLTKKL